MQCFSRLEAALSARASRSKPLSAPASCNRLQARLLTGARLSSLLGAALLVGCASTPRGATEANMAKARNGDANGHALFEQQCASCHGERGESAGAAPRILGEGALPEYPAMQDANADPAAGDPELLRLRAQSRPAGAPSRDPFRTAQDLYGYVSTHMPLPAEKAGTLSPEQYWAVIHFMLLAHGVQVPPEGVNRNNASSVKL